MKLITLSPAAPLQAPESRTAAVVELWAQEPAESFDVEESWFRAREEGWFQVLSYRLLLKGLSDEPLPELHARMIRAAHESAMLAWNTPYPLLLFPCLFQERASAACDRARREAQGYWRGLN